MSGTTVYCIDLIEIIQICPIFVVCPPPAPPPLLDLENLPSEIRPGGCVILPPV